MENLNILNDVMLSDNVTEQFKTALSNKDFRTWLTSIMPEIEDCENQQQDNQKIHQLEAQNAEKRENALRYLIPKRLGSDSSVLSLIFVISISECLSKKSRVLFIEIHSFGLIFLNFRLPFSSVNTRVKKE